MFGNHPWVYYLCGAMLRKLIEIELDHMRMTIALKLSELGLPFSDDTLPSIIKTYVDSLYTCIEEHFFNERTRLNNDFINLQIQKERIEKECDDKVSSKDKEIEKERAEKSKYKRKFEDEQKENIRQKEWNQALVEIIKENGLELPKDIPHTYIPPRTQPNSDNSSLPSSKNPIGYKRGGNRGYQKRPKSDKKPGGQFGHKPSNREPDKNPTEVVALTPEQCSYCNHSLEGVEGKEGETRQVIDIPEIVQLDITDYKSIKKKCPHCGQITSGSFPDGVNANFSYGPRIIATVALLCHFMNCSWNKIVTFLECLYNLHISEGTIGNMLKKFALNCEEDYQKIKEEIKSGRIVHADETVITKDGIRRHIWVFVTQDAVYLVYNISRCMDVLFQEFPYGLPESVLVTDRYAAYFNKEFKVRTHQVCLPHLVRNCRGLTEKAPNCQWVKDFKAFIERAMKARDDLSIDRDLLFLERDELLEKEPPFTDPKERKKVIQFFKNMQKVKEYLLVFLTQEEVPHNNNRAEQSLRDSKSKLKQAGTFRSEEGPEQYVRTQSILQTEKAKNNGKFKFSKLVSIARRNKKKPKKKDKPGSVTKKGEPQPSLLEEQHEKCCLEEESS